MPPPSLAEYHLHCTPFSRNRHSEQKRARGSSLLSWGATHCSILRLQDASAAMSSVSQRPAACMAPSALSHHQRLAIPGPPKCYRPKPRVPLMAHAAYRNELRTCVRVYISGCIKAVTPFHLPKSTVVSHVTHALHRHCTNTKMP